MTDLGAISAACTVTIGAAKVCHCADIYTGTGTVWLALVLT